MLLMRQVSVYVRYVQLANETRAKWTSISIMLSAFVNRWILDHRCCEAKGS